MTGFVDIHSHFLYGLDDGAGTVEDSLAMLALAQASGTTALVATPHANGRYPFRPDLIEEQIVELQPRTLVRLHRGCDFHLSAGNVEDARAHPAKYTVNSGAYLLVEFPELVVFRAADGILRALLDAGMVPIITHPERNEHLRGQTADLARWVDEGCYVQVTAGSFAGTFGPDARRGAEVLFTRGLVHIVASDGHNVRRRPPVLRDAYQGMAERWGEERVRGLFVENPAAVVANEVMAFEPEPVRERKRWYQFWKSRDKA